MDRDVQPERRLKQIQINGIDLLINSASQSPYSIFVSEEIKPDDRQSRAIRLNKNIEMRTKFDIKEESFINTQHSRLSGEQISHQSSPEMMEFSEESKIMKRKLNNNRERRRDRRSDQTIRGKEQRSNSILSNPQRNKQHGRNNQRVHFEKQTPNFLNGEQEVFERELRPKNKLNRQYQNGDKQIINLQRIQSDSNELASSELISHEGNGAADNTNQNNNRIFDKLNKSPRLSTDGDQQIDTDRSLLKKGKENKRGSYMINSYPSKSSDSDSSIKTDNNSFDSSQSGHLSQEDGGGGQQINGMKALQNVGSLLNGKPPKAKRAKTDIGKNKKSKKRSSDLNQMLKRKKTMANQRFTVKDKQNKQLIQQHKFEVQKNKNMLFSTYQQKKKADGGLLGSLDMTQSEYFSELLKMSNYSDDYRSFDLGGQRQEQKFIIPFNSANGRRFDLITCCLCIYDCVMVPFYLTFGPNIFSKDVQDTLKIIDILIKIVFAVDILIGFRRAYLSESGIQITCPKKIAKNYLKFFFWIDLLSCIPFFLFTDDPYLNLLSLVKVFRLNKISTIILYLGFAMETRSRLRIIQLIIGFVIIIHWITCYFYVITLRNWNSIIQDINSKGADPEDYYLIKDGKVRRPVFNFNYWMPQVEINDAVTVYYDLIPNDQYIQLFYYVMLLIFGNDINPQTNDEILACTIFLYVGACTVAIIFGGVTAEMNKVLDQNKDKEITLDYVYFTLQIHQIPVEVKYDCLRYLTIMDENQDAKPFEVMQEFFSFLNPKMMYDIQYHIYYDKLNNMDTFKNAEMTEIMFIANHMNAKLYTQDQEIISQGDNADAMFIIFRGNVIVNILETQFKQDCDCDKEMEHQREENRRLQLKKRKFMGQLKQQVKQKLFKDMQNQFGNGLIEQMPIGENSSSYSSFASDDIVFDDNTNDMDIDSYQKFLQYHYRISTRKGQQLSKKFNKNWNDIVHTKIDIRMLQEGDLFGEVGLLTNLKRTASVVTVDPTVVQVLSRESVEKISEKLPLITNMMQEKMNLYDDEDMAQRCLFVSNIPFLRGLSQDVIRQVSYLMREQIFEYGERIISYYEVNCSILILWEGQIQIRVQRKDPETEKEKDFWFGNLSKGACFDIFNSFQMRHTSLVSYFTSSRYCTIKYIRIDDLYELAKSCIPLQDRLNEAKLKIQSRMIDDIDFQTFPRKFLKENLRNKLSDEEIYLKNKKRLKVKRIMISQILKFVSQLKRGECTYPKAINLLEVIREDRQKQRRDVNNLMQQALQQQSEQFNIRQLFQTFKKKKYRKRVLQLQQELQEIDDDYDIRTPTTIASEMDSEQSIKNLSFLTKVESQQENQNNNQIINEKQKSVVSQTSSKLEQIKLRQDIKAYKLYQIQCKSAMHYIKDYLNCHPSQDLVASFLQQIERYVFRRRNFELFQEVITKETDETFQFRNQIQTSTQHIQQIFCNYDHDDFVKLTSFIKKDDDQIFWRKPKEPKERDEEIEVKSLNFENLGKPNSRQDSRKSKGKRSYSLQNSLTKVRSVSEKSQKSQDQASKEKETILSDKSEDPMELKQSIRQQRRSRLSLRFQSFKRRISKPFKKNQNKSTPDKMLANNKNDNLFEDKSLQESLKKSQKRRMTSFGTGIALTDIKNSAKQASEATINIKDKIVVSTQHLGSDLKQNELGNKIASGIKTGVVDGFELATDVVVEGVEIAKDIVGLNKDQLIAQQITNSKQRRQANGSNSSSEEEEESEEEVVDELEVDPQLQNWVYQESFLQDYELLSDHYSQNLKSQDKLEQLMQEIAKQQELIDNLKAKMGAVVEQESGNSGELSHASKGRGRQPRMRMLN